MILIGEFLLGSFCYNNCILSLYWYLASGVEENTKKGVSMLLPYHPFGERFLFYRFSFKLYARYIHGETMRDWHLELKKTQKRKRFNSTTMIIPSTREMLVLSFYLFLHHFQIVCSICTWRDHNMYQGISSPIWLNTSWFNILWSWSRWCLSLLSF